MDRSTRIRTCQPMASWGEKCSLGQVKGDLYVDACPCRAGSGMFYSSKCQSFTTDIFLYHRFLLIPQRSLHREVNMAVKSVYPNKEESEAKTIESHHRSLSHIRSVTRKKKTNCPKSVDSIRCLGKQLSCLCKNHSKKFLALTSRRNKKLPSSHKNVTIIKTSLAGLPCSP
jgi:hypothetical protein